MGKILKKLFIKGDIIMKEYHLNIQSGRLNPNSLTSNNVPISIIIPPIFPEFELPHFLVVRGYVWLSIVLILDKSIPRKMLLQGTLGKCRQIIGECGNLSDQPEIVAVEQSLIT